MIAQYQNLIIGLLGGGFLVKVGEWFLSGCQRSARSRRAVHAKLQTIRVYVTGARGNLAHQELQVQWSHQCAALFGEAAWDAIEMGRSVPDLAQLARLLGGWLSLAPVLGHGDRQERDEKVKNLYGHLTELDQTIERTMKLISPA